MRILSMPDKWEYPWFAAWDLAFQCSTIALIDPGFAAFFFSSSRRHTRWTGDWSSDVCSSDLRRRQSGDGNSPSPGDRATGRHAEGRRRQYADTVGTDGGVELECADGRDRVPDGARDRRGRWWDHDDHGHERRPEWHVRHHGAGPAADGGGARSDPAPGGRAPAAEPGRLHRAPGGHPAG